MGDTIHISVSDLNFMRFPGYGWDQNELTVAWCEFGRVCYVTQEEEYEHIDLFVIIDYNLSEKRPGNQISDNKGFLKIIFPRMKLINGTVYLGQDKLNDSPERVIEYEQFDQKIEGEYKIYTINLPLSWYLGRQSLDESINKLDVPLRGLLFETVAYI